MLQRSFSNKMQEGHPIRNRFEEPNTTLLIQREEGPYSMSESNFNAH